MPSCSLIRACRRFGASERLNADYALEGAALNVTLPYPFYSFRRSKPAQPLSQTRPSWSLSELVPLDPYYGQDPHGSLCPCNARPCTYTVSLCKASAAVGCCAAAACPRNDRPPPIVAPIGGPGRGTATAQPTAQGTKRGPGWQWVRPLGRTDLDCHGASRGRGSGAYHDIMPLLDGFRRGREALHRRVMPLHYWTGSDGAVEAFRRCRASEFTD